LRGGGGGRRGLGRRWRFFVMGVVGPWRRTEKRERVEREMNV